MATMRKKKLPIKKSLLKKLQIKNLTSSWTTAMKTVHGDEGDGGARRETSIESSGEEWRRSSKKNRREEERVQAEREERGRKMTQRGLE